MKNAQSRVLPILAFAAILASILCVWPGLTPLLADQADTDFAQKLEARGYYDLLELQYKDWLADQRLSKEERARKAQGLVGVYTRLAATSADLRDRKRYQEQATQLIAQLKKESLPPPLALRLALDEAQILLDDARAMGTVPPPVVDDDGESKASPGEQAWNRILTHYAKISKDASAALEAVLRSRKTGSAAVEEQTRLEGLLLEAGLRTAWAKYYFALALPPKHERRPKLLREATGTFEMTATSYPDKDIRQECVLGCALCAKEAGNKQRAVELFDEVSKNAANPPAVRAALYNKASLLYEAKQYEAALRAADSAVNVVSRTPDVEMERAALLLKARAGYAFAATQQGAAAAKIRADAEKAALTVAQAGGKWAPLAQEIIVTAGGAGSADAAGFQALVQADKLYDQQKWNDAAAAYEDFIGKKPAGASKSVIAAAQVKLGFSYYRQQAFDKASRVFRALLDTTPDPGMGARAAYYMAVSSGLAAGQSGKAEDLAAYAEALSLVEKRYPDHEEMDNVQFRLGGVLETTGKYAEAPKKYRAVRQGAKDYREAQLRAGICDTVLLSALWKKDAPAAETKPLADSAIKSLKAASTPVDEADTAGARLAADASNRLARLYLSSTVDKPQEALEALKDFEKKYSSAGLSKEEHDRLLGDISFLRFWAYEKQGKLEDAQGALRDAVTRQPTSPQIPPAFETLAVACDDAARKAKGDQAKELRMNAIALLDSYLSQFGQTRPEGYERLVLRRASLHSEMGNWDKAVADYEHLYHLYPGARNINKELANAYAKAGKFDMALKLFLDLEEGSEPYSHNWWDARYSRALMYSRMGDNDKMSRLIEATRIVREDLGGPEWKAKFEELLAKASKKP